MKATEQPTPKQRWSYRQITEHTEHSIRRSLQLAAESSDMEVAGLHRVFAMGAYQLWDSLTKGGQEPGDDHRLAVLADAYCVCETCGRQRRAADAGQVQS